MASGISLSNKSQLLFGCVVVVILAAALSVPWFRTNALVREYRSEVARRLGDAWLAERAAENLPDTTGVTTTLETMLDEEGKVQSLRIALVSLKVIKSAPEQVGSFVVDAYERFDADPDTVDYVAVATLDDQIVYRYAQPLRASELPSSNFITGDVSTEDDDPLAAVLVVDSTSAFAEGQLLISRIYIIAAGLMASLLAVLLFYFILTKLILFPVRRLRETADTVQHGDLTIRAQIDTGDEFEQLSDAFNGMLDSMEQSQAQLRAMNESLDLKLSELSEANIGLYESNRLKSEFLASVSHELRTPLNSIIGFTELLEELARTDDQVDPKRLRYIANILASARSLLEMINDLLDMAKIEAGRMEVNIEPTSVGDLVEGLIGIMRPQARAKEIDLGMVIGAHVPMIETDPGKLQQILYNFLSNAIKYTPVGGKVTISADRVTRQDNSLGVRLSVSDSGPGIPSDMQDVIFDKFRQLDASHTREHAGTGLGLAICRELAELLSAEVSFVSEPGRGATFYVDLPLTHQTQEQQPLMA
jgi:signal transduction histidine kinase